MLPEDATDAGLLGVSFFGGRGLSRPFSGGECAGLARGVAGSCGSTETAVYATPRRRPLKIPRGAAHLVRHVHHQVVALLSIAVLEDNCQTCHPTENAIADEDF